jgi:putative ABC transport system substrate-binding protein
MNFGRRHWLITAGALLAAPRLAWTQPTTRKFRIGWISSGPEALKEPQALAFVRRLAELGFVEGRNLAIERRHANGRLDRMPAVSAELAKLNCDAYFGSGGEGNLTGLTQADRKTPIVFVAVDFDPVTTGDVASLSRPGGRVTGITALQSALPAKRLELLKELLPNLARVAVLANEETTSQLLLVQGTARRIGVALHVVDFKRPPFDYEAGFAEVARARVDALFALGSGLFVPARRLIVEKALKARLPTMFHNAQWTDAGGLMSYGFNFPGMWRRGAEILASVLQGSKPADIPMEQPTNFELVFNLKTARILGVKIPQSLLVRADRVID